MKRLLLSLLVVLGLAQTGFGQNYQVEWLQDRYGTRDTLFATGVSRPFPRAVIRGLGPNEYVQNGRINVPDYGCGALVNNLQIVPDNPQGIVNDTFGIFYNTNWIGVRAQDGRYTIDIDIYSYDTNTGLSTPHHLILPDAIYLKGYGSNPNGYTISPSYAEPGQTLDVSITTPSRVDQASSSLYVDLDPQRQVLEYSYRNNVLNSFTVTGPNSAVANITVPPNQAPGLYNWMATSYGPCALNYKGFEVRARTGTTPPAGRIRGLVYADFDSNCTYSNTSDGFRSRTLVRAQGADSTYFGLTDQSGHYSIEVPAGTYTVRPVSRDGSQLHSCQGERSVIVLMDSLFVDSVDFADSSRSDVQLGLYIGWERPGRAYWAQVYAGNMGEVPQDTRIVLEMDTLAMVEPSSTDSLYIDSVVGRRVFLKPVHLQPQTGIYQSSF